MPKVKLGQHPMTRLLRGICSVPELAACLGCCYNTAHAKMHDPTRLTVGDLMRLRRSFALTDKEIMGAIGFDNEI